MFNIAIHFFSETKVTQLNSAKKKREFVQNLPKRHEEQKLGREYFKSLFGK